MLPHWQSGSFSLFARSLGSISSDLLFKKFGFRGRIWVQFLPLFFEAIFEACVSLPQIPSKVA